MRSSNIENTGEVYPHVSERVKAALVDVVVLIGFMVFFSLVFSSFDAVPDRVRMLAFIFIFGLYDPIFTSCFGGTIGHFAIGIRVKRVDDELRNIPFLLAVFRYILKISLGWLSLLTVGTNDKRLAIHDLAGQSIVVFKDADPHLRGDDGSGGSR